ncbi:MULTISPECIES: type II secretion system secretin GspD [unclassified Polaromonas]|uniref:type II secretion system secretin GspD n=1 Tax=unclassified Polaromonas TaxID=2638319 RepID=UPI0018CAC3F3|nr:MULTISPECIES: type II secretion system secretin GspD [unclassified Polaromonas]MBG6112710.1 general secretion pathway protein D [Polaromonas sp. CG_9.2]MDH6186185.1 general secretion pathway protein D [Polaromonas sp. CG_23.6]
MKHPNFKRHQIAIFSIAGSALLACGTGIFPSNSQAQPQVASPASEGRRGEAITLNFVNANIDAVARTMATLTGRNVVVDPRVKGTITLTTERPVSPALAYTQFLAILRLQGFTVVNSAGLDKIVPEADAKLQGGAVSTNVPVAGGQIATTIFKLSFENANNLLPILRPLISPNNTINVNPGNNSLVITDYADNLNRLGRIISALDVSNATNVELIPVRYASVTDLAPLLTRLLDNSASGGVATAEASYKTTVLPEPRSNSLIVRAANGARLELVKSLLKTLDTPNLNGPNGDAGNIYVVYLKNADATNMASVLRAAMSGTGGSGSSSPALPFLGNPSAINTGAQSGGANNLGQSSSAATTPITPSAGPSTGGQIQADPATNSLIITASEPQYRQLRAVIEKLDGRRAQVYVESLIAEVNMDKAAEFGIQWQGPLGGKGDSLIGLLGTNFGTSGKNIIQSALGASNGTPLPPGTGFNLGVAARNNGVYFLGFLANFLQTSGAGNILSTPNLITLDNEEAKIIIGQNVPFVTGQFTNTGGGGNGSVNPFQTIERKDVGLTLRVKPQISENGTVKMSIFQEVSSVQPGSVNSATGIITNKRSIESNVLVEDGAIIVLGGLLQDEYSGNDQKVPGLGDVPVFGNLFKSESRSRKKTNLMVFLRPVVVRDGASTNALSMDRYDLMRTTQQQTQPRNSSLVPINESPVLPDIKPMPGVAPASPVPAPLFQTTPLPMINDR